MLKVIRSANKSVLDDAIDTQDTAVTLQGPEQPDEDDYGYTSNVASAIYQQLMDKYKATPEEKKFRDGEKRTMSKEEMQKAKARVKDASAASSSRTRTPSTDSEMDDFIDDEGAEEDISSHIRAIFGYDKSRYRDEDFDDRTMESNFAQVQREEYISKKIGLQEDLEDMRLEEEEKRQKALAKKKAASAKGSG
ncbi:hypothetical protein quinque_015964, partial [Culex quinquefasciatus]